jgi:hypothetical protein
MNDPELVELEERLRRLLAAVNLDWLLPEIDATIAEGVILQKTVEEEYGDATIYEVRGERPTTRRRPRRRQVRVTSRPLNRRERVQVVIDAIRRVGVDGPRMEQAMLTHLSAIEESAHAPQLRSVDFLPDEEDAAGTEVRITSAGRDERDTAAIVLERLLNNLQDLADR